ncbi:unnamed protein product [Rhizoctonia solani]|uniref:Secreted protein n=1 Tax=Rhizoctonia solani TaxID=456999 RepID=A0A8H2XBQ3_9AGAM|nr:unnamed protein product [Rhizoctonia solani]
MVSLKLTAALAACASLVAAVPTYKQSDGCGQNYFWFAPKSTCLRNGTKDKCTPPAQQNCGRNWNGTKDKCTPPAQQNCGRNWYWHQTYKYCVPPSPTYGDAGCEDGWTWNDDKYSCVPAPPPAPAPGQCNSTDFYWKPKSTCLPYGGDSNPPSPPNGDQCPDKWYWRAAGHCAPRKPDHGSPDCSSQYSWNKDKFCCTKRY